VCWQKEQRLQTHALGSAPSSTGRSLIGNKVSTPKPMASHRALTSQSTGSEASVSPISPGGPKSCDSFGDDNSRLRDRCRTERLVAARWLLVQDFEPIMLRASTDTGWAVGWPGWPQRLWPSMLHQQQSHRHGVQRSRARDRHVYLSNREVLDYLHRYAETFGLTSRIARHARETDR